MNTETHEVRHGGKLIGHFSEDDAHKFVDRKIAESGLDDDHAAQRKHDEAWTVERRKRIEVRVRGNLVETFDDPEEANAHADELREALGAPALPAPAFKAHHVEVAIDRATGLPIQEKVFHTVTRMVADKDNKGRVRRTNVSEPVLDPKTKAPITREKVGVREVEHVEEVSDPVEVVDTAPVAVEAVPKKKR